MKFEYNGNSEKSGIYQIYNSVKDRSYIGQTSREFFKRWCEHKNSLLDSSKSRGSTNKWLKRDFQKCFLKEKNDDFLVFNILEVIEDKTKLDEREIFWIAKFKEEKKKIYNFNNGGNGHYLISEETRKKMSLAKIGKHQSEHHKKKISKALKGKVRSNETKKKMSLAKKGKIVSVETKEKLSFSHIGKYHSYETKHKMSISRSGEKHYLFGKHQSEQTKKKISEKNKGKKMGIDSKFAKIYDLSQNPLISPTGEQFTRIECASEFARKYNLNPSNIISVINNKRFSHKGWKLKK